LQLLQAFPSLRDDDLVMIYAAKALSSSNVPYERRHQVSSSALSIKPIGHVVPPMRTNFSTGLTSLQKRAFSWAQRDTGNKIISPDSSSSRKRKSTGTLPPFQKATWEALAGLPEETSLTGPTATVENYGRLAPAAMTEEWVLTGDSQKDDAVRSLHRYASAPNFVLFKALLELCSGGATAAKAAVDLCITQIKKDLSSDQLPLASFHDSAERAFHATNVFVKALTHAQDLLSKLLGEPGNLSSSAEAAAAVTQGTKNIREEQHSSQVATSKATPGRNTGAESPIQTDLSGAQAQAELWLNRVELLQSLFGSYFPASLDDLLDEGSTKQLRDRLISHEHYHLADLTCRKCEIDAFPVWEAWGHALLRIENYAQARVKFKQCLQLHDGDPAPVVRDIVFAMDNRPPAEVFAARSLYVHTARSVSSSSDDSLSADSYLNVLYMPSFNKQDRSRRSSEDSADSHQAPTMQGNIEECPRTHLDDQRYEESVYYLQEVSYLSNPLSNIVSLTILL
jgi:zinc finger FYVE domain-containing protein 26